MQHCKEVMVFKALSTIKDKEYRQWARDNFIPFQRQFNPLWHPVIIDECCTILKEEHASRSKIISYDTESRP